MMKYPYRPLSLFAYPIGAAGSLSGLLRKSDSYTIVSA
jgi:hypothetical protein